MNTLNRLYPFTLLLYFVSIVFVCYFSIQKQFVTILIPSGFAFLAFFVLLKSLKNPQRFIEIVILIFIVKLSILFSFPHLSDDIYRFWWDGFLNYHGISPYQFSPSEIITKLQSADFYPSLIKNYPLLNSARIHTVYPLICQWIFRFSAGISGNNLYVFNLILKLIFLIVDCTILYFLIKLSTFLKLPIKYILIYYGNPLCLIELNANLHFEIFLTLFLVISIYLYEKKSYSLSGLLLGLSVASKLVSFIWMPLFIKLPIWKKTNALFLIGLIIPIGLFIYVLFPSILSYQNSLSLYFQKFEFNSFIYRPLLNYFDNHHWYEYEINISLVLMILFCFIYLIIILMDWIKNIQGFSFNAAWLILFSYLLFGTTIHPWYLTPLLLMSIFTFQYTGLAWSFLILLSYARYDFIFEPYKFELIFLEYLIVLIIFIYEFNNRQNRINEQNS